MKPVTFIYVGYIDKMKKFGHTVSPMLLRKFRKLIFEKWDWELFPEHK